jgi:hypothetical protein
LAKAISIGLRSGEYFGKNRNQAPRSASALAARGLLWTFRLSSANEVRRGDHDIATSEAWRELRADIAIESGTIHGSLNDPRGNKLIAAQTGDEGLRLPLAEGGIGHEPLSLQAAPTQGRHVGLYARFIDEDEPRRLAAHKRLAALVPCPAGHLDVSAFFLGGQQRFFYR